MLPATVVDRDANLKQITLAITPAQAIDYTVTLTVIPDAMKTQVLGSRGSVQMYDFGQAVNGTMKSVGKVVLKASEGSQASISAIFNNAGTLRIRATATYDDIFGESDEITVQHRIRKYAELPSDPGYDLNQHDDAFVTAAGYWGSVYLHDVDPELLKAIGMAESEIGLIGTDDIMTIGNPGDATLEKIRGTPPYDQFPVAEREVDIPNNTTRRLSYPQADATPPATAILYGTCWLYHKAQSILDNPSPPPAYIPGSWRTWDDAVTAFNGGGVQNYLERVHKALLQGRHPTASAYIWPLKTDGRARGN